MKKCIVLAVLSTTILMTGCGKKDTQPVETTAIESSTDIEVKDDSNATKLGQSSGSSFGESDKMQKVELIVPDDEKKNSDDEKKNSEGNGGSADVATESVETTETEVDSENELLLALKAVEDMFPERQIPEADENSVSEQLEEISRNTPKVQQGEPAQEIMPMNTNVELP